MKGVAAPGLATQVIQFHAAWHRADEMLVQQRIDHVRSAIGIADLGAAIRSVISAPFPAADRGRRDPRKYPVDHGNSNESHALPSRMCRFRLQAWHSNAFSPAQRHLWPQPCLWTSGALMMSVLIGLSRGDSGMRPTR